VYAYLVLVVPVDEIALAVDAHCHRNTDIRVLQTQQTTVIINSLLSSVVYNQSFLQKFSKTHSVI